MRNNGYITTGRTSEGENIDCRITQPSDDHIGVHIYAGYTDDPVFSIVLGDDTDNNVEGCTIDDLSMCWLAQPIVSNLGGSVS